MVDLEYLSMDEVPSIPTRKEPFGVAVYAPVDQRAAAARRRARARQRTPAHAAGEAAQAAGVAGAAPAMGRPTCALLPQALNGQRAGASLGCIGNRVYTALDDSEAYFAIPGAAVAAVEERLRVIVHANQELETFHRARAQG